ncbi:hypothetical protein ACSTS3_06130 [Aquimarina muelleri]|uniref:hypothetical protein n=1 Tax=Aquimarina muelleri TaxID=279356 RepID=UPI003F688368
MFNKNKNISVGRDINIQMDKKNFENLNNDELTEKKNNSKLILNKENGIKIRKLLNWLIFAVILFFLLYIGIPYMLNNFGNEENILVTFFLKVFQDGKTSLMLSSLASFMAILSPISDLWKSNEIEKKQYEILKAIAVILKEREYLK